MNSVYLDCNASTPMEPEVLELVFLCMKEEYANPGSRSHEYGYRVNKRIETARKQVAEVVGCRSDEVYFTSGATESDNIAILGIVAYGLKENKKHIISSVMEHKAVIETLKALETKGFEITLLSGNEKGVISIEELSSQLREDTLLVTIHHVNNETGVIQPLDKVAEYLQEHNVFFHTDAAQGFGKEFDFLKNPRIDMISISGHKIYGPKGIGALILRKRDFETLPISPLFYGGNQERGIRPGTPASPLIAGLGLAAEIALRDRKKREEINRKIKKKAMSAFNSLTYFLNGDPDLAVLHTMNIAFDGLNGQSVILLWKELVACSTGSACNSGSYKPSHVLEGMGLNPERVDRAVRLSWCHMTPEIPWEEMADKIRELE